MAFSCLILFPLQTSTMHNLDGIFCHSRGVIASGEAGTEETSVEIINWEKATPKRHSNACNCEGKCSFIRSASISAMIYFGFHNDFKYHNALRGFGLDFVSIQHCHLGTLYYKHNCTEETNAIKYATVYYGRLRLTGEKNIFNSTY